MSDGDLLQRTVRDNPDDDTAQLVYADWLEENGAAHAAVNIRVGVRLRRETDWRITVAVEELVSTVAGAHEFAPAVNRGFLELIMRDSVPIGSLGILFGPVTTRDQFGYVWNCSTVILSRCVPAEGKSGWYHIFADTAGVFTRLTS